MNPNVTQLVTHQTGSQSQSVTHVTQEFTLVENLEENHKDARTISESNLEEEQHTNVRVTWVTDSYTEPLTGVQDGVTLGFSEPPSRVTEAAIENEPVLKPLKFNIKVGDRIRCYPTPAHAENKWQVTAKVTEVESSGGWFLGCTVEYCDKRKGTVISRIAGGSVDLILSKV